MERNIKSVMNSLYEGKSLSETDSQFIFGEIFSGKLSEIELSGLLIALKMKGETAEEISGAAKSMKAFCNSIDVDSRPVFDTCGTGGDSAGMINVSSSVSIILSSMGVPVAKHGNRSVSGKSGSTDFMESLGIPADLKGADAEKYFEEKDYIYMAAPNYHPAMKYAVPIRQGLATRTIFNYLGPLTNPAGTKRQAIGVFSPELLETYAETAKNLGLERAVVYSGMDGMDEVSPYAKTKAFEIQNGQIKEFMIDPTDYFEAGEEKAIPLHLTPEENAKLFSDTVSSGSVSPVSKLLAMNAAVALYAYDENTDIKENYDKALKVMTDGTVKNRLEELRKA